MLLAGRFDRRFCATDAQGTLIFYPEGRFRLHRDASGLVVARGVVVADASRRTALLRLWRRWLVWRVLMAAALFVPALMFALPEVRGPGLDAQQPLVFGGLFYLALTWTLDWMVWRRPLRRLTADLVPHESRQPLPEFLAARRAATSRSETALAFGAMALVLGCLARFAWAMVRDHHDEPKELFPVLALMGLPALALSWLLCGALLVGLIPRLGEPQRRRQWWASATALCGVVWAAAIVVLRRAALE